MDRTITPTLNRQVGRLGLLLALACPGLPAIASEDAFLGTWLTDAGASKVDVRAGKASDGSTVYTGTLVWLKEPMRDGQAVRDGNNSDPALRARPLIGIEVLSGFKATADGWSGGTVYAPRAGKSFPADLSLMLDGRLQVKVKAGLFTKTDYWTR